MFKLKRSLLLLMVLFFVVGCGSSDTSTNDAPTNDASSISSENIINSYYGFYEKITEMQEVDTKSKFETNQEYIDRVDSYIEEQGILYFDTKLSDSYDAETQTVKLASSSIYFDKFAFTFGEYYNSQYIHVDNIVKFPNVVNKSSLNTIITFAEFNLEPNLAQQQSGNYRIIIGVKLKRFTGQYNNDLIYRIHNSSLGTVYRIQSELVSFKAYNSLTPNEIITEYTLTEP